MTLFNGGPAEGQFLCLREAPEFLRVTWDGQKFDALDQPLDAPVSRETLTAYKLKEFRGRCHVNRGKGRGGFFVMAQYDHVQEQPPQAIMFNREEWEHWCLCNASHSPA